MAFKILAVAFLSVAAFAEEIPTFNRDIAPIVFEHCVQCHHPGGNSPFSLANYTEVKKRAKLVSTVITNRFMPPWMPEPGHGEFVGERRLTNPQIALIERWEKAGAPEGKARDLKAKATWIADWQLGTPDLIVTLPEAYSLAAEGPDIYRNFVIPNVVPEDRYLRASEFRPGATSAIHHAFVMIDVTGGARKRDAEDINPGFPGMDTAGAGAPAAMFMGWQPGKRPSEAPAGLAGTLRKGSDLVLQLHLRPTGKPEKIQPTVGLYFTDQPPKQSALLLLLRSVNFEIPPGEHAYGIESSYTLPVDTEVLAILPHLHYLGKEVHAWAELPDGTRKELILIRRWDFNWQGDYRYSNPVILPKDSTVRVRLVYDNSASNSRNPNRPPRLVRYGPQSSDEMAELWLQLLPRNPADFVTLRSDVDEKVGLPDAMAWARAMLRLNPKDAVSRSKLGAALAVSGRRVEAVRELLQAVEDDPNLARAHYLLGKMFTEQQNYPKARAAFERAIVLEPDNARTCNDLGWLFLITGDIPKAIEHFEKAVQLDPIDPLPRQNLEKARILKSNQRL